MTAYVNLHGHPLDVSAADAVRRVHPKAVAKEWEIAPGSWYVIVRDHPHAAIIGTGANAESAWRDAWSRMLADDMQREAGQ